MNVSLSWLRLGASLNFWRQVPFPSESSPAQPCVQLGSSLFAIPFTQLLSLDSLSCCLSSCVGICPQVIFFPESGIFSESLQWCSEGMKGRVWESGLWAGVALGVHLPFTPGRLLALAPLCLSVGEVSPRTYTHGVIIRIRWVNTQKFHLIGTCLVVSE